MKTPMQSLFVWVARRPVVMALAAMGILAMIFWVPKQQVVTASRYQALRSSSPKSGEASIDDIGNHTLGFEKIFVIGLPERSDRRDRMTLLSGLTEVHIEFIDGVRGGDVLEKAIPYTSKHERIPAGALGCWRAHINAIREVVLRNLTSALIFEDDADWDVRLRRQLTELALSTRALVQPLATDPKSYADPTFEDPLKDPHASPTEMDFDKLPETVPPKISPYGDDWDLLWIGHCGMQMASKEEHKMPKGRVVRLEDESVPQKQHLWTHMGPFTLVNEYPHQARVVHHVQDGVCTNGYAISQRGARALLQQLGLKDPIKGVDLLLGDFCNGRNDRGVHRCLGVQPSLTGHHHAVGPNAAASDIGDRGGGFNTEGRTDMIRWSTIMNADEILKGGGNFVDALPNDETKAAQFDIDRKKEAAKKKKEEEEAKKKEKKE